MTPAIGLADLQARFGALVLEHDVATGGYHIVSPPHWESQNMVMVNDLPGISNRLYVNKAIVEPLRSALAAAQLVCPEYQIRTIGCFNPRLKRVNGDVSVHSWGLAVDINADTNPLADDLTTDMPDAFVRCFKGQGFTWGGEFSGKKDAMHYQYISGY